MYVKTYLKQHPKSYLARELRGYSPDTEIIIGSGTITDNPNSNLQRTIKEYGGVDYVVGARASQYKSDGNFFAVILRKKEQGE